MQLSFCLSVLDRFLLTFRFWMLFLSFVVAGLKIHKYLAMTGDFQSRFQPAEVQWWWWWCYPWCSRTTRSLDSFVPSSYLFRERCHCLFSWSLAKRIFSTEQQQPTLCNPFGISFLAQYLFSVPEGWGGVRCQRFLLCVWKQWMGRFVTN